MDIGTAKEKQENFADAVKAYEKAADRYNDRKPVAADALFKAGLAYQKQANALGMLPIAMIEVMRRVSEGKVKITPDVVVSGGGGARAASQ